MRVLNNGGEDMANMGYCRFENTLHDLRDCYDHIDDDLSAEEAQARTRILGICKDIAIDYCDCEEL